MTWLTNNPAVVIWMITVSAGVIAGWAVNNFRIKSHDERLHDLETRFNEHSSDTRLHIDPARDQAIWRTFQDETSRRFDGIDRKLDKLMLVSPTPPI